MKMIQLQRVYTQTLHNEDIHDLMVWRKYEVELIGMKVNNVIIDF
jgi:hypothetical protein